MLFNTDSFFCFIRKCLFRSLNHRMRSFPRFYIRTFVVFVIYKLYFASYVKQSYIPVCGWYKYFFINIKTLRKSKVFLKNNLQMYAIGLLIISYQFILRRWNLMDSLQYGKKLLKLNITYNHNRIKQSHIVEYLGCRLNANLRI